MQAGGEEIFGQIDSSLAKGADEFGVEVRADRFAVPLESMSFEDLLQMLCQLVSKRDDVVIVTVDHRPGSGYAWLRLRRTSHAVRPPQLYG